MNRITRERRERIKVETNDPEYYGKFLPKRSDSVEKLVPKRSRWQFWKRR